MDLNYRVWENNRGSVQQKAVYNHFCSVLHNQYLNAYPAYHHDRESALLPSCVQVISEEDIAAEKYSIEDIVLPLPG